MQRPRQHNRQSHADSLTECCYVADHWCVCRGLLDGAFPTDRAVLYSFGLVLPRAHIPSAPKLQVQLRILEMRQLLQQARSKADAAATAAVAAEEAAKSDAAANGRRTVTARRSARLAERQVA
jgi:hypothetical protein